MRHARPDASVGCGGVGSESALVQIAARRIALVRIVWLCCCCNCCVVGGRSAPAPVKRSGGQAKPRAELSSHTIADGEPAFLKGRQLSRAGRRRLPVPVPLERQRPHREVPAAPQARPIARFRVDHGNPAGAVSAMRSASAPVNSSAKAVTISRPDRPGFAAAQPSRVQRSTSAATPWH